MTTEATRTPLAEVWMALAVRDIEQTGPLDDAQALAEAARLQSTPQQHLRERAWLLGQRLGLAAQMARWHEAAWLLGAILALAWSATWCGQPPLCWCWARCCWPLPFANIA